MPVIEIPDVVHHNEVRSVKQLQEICQRYVETEKKPCAIVKIDGKVCFAYMHMDGSSDPVQCYIRITEYEL